MYKQLAPQIEHVSNGNGTVTVPSAQLITRQFENRLVVESVNPAPSTSVFSDAGKAVFTVDMSNYREPRDMKLVHNITVASAAVNFSDIFSRVEWLEMRVGTTEVGRISGDALRLQLEALSERERRTEYRQCNIAPDGGTAEPLAVGNHIISLPLYATWLDSCPHLWAKLRSSDVRITIQYRSGVVSGSLSNVTLTGIDVVTEDAIPTAGDYAKRVMRHNKYAESFHMLKWEEVRDATRTFVASTTYNISLDALKGRIPAFIVGFRATASPAIDSANSIAHYLDIGDESTLNLVTAAGEGLYGQDGVKCHYLKRNWVRHFPNSDRNQTSNQALYVIPFGDQLADTMKHNRLLGWKNFNGSKWNLQIANGAAGTAEVHTVDLGVANCDGGNYRLAFGGQTSTTLGFDATVGAMKTSFEAIPIVRQHGYTVTFSATAEQDFTVTFSARDGSPYNDHSYKVEVLPDSLLDGTVMAEPSTTVSTVGKTGGLVGAYTVDVFAAIYQKSTLEPNSNLTIELA